MWRLEIGFDNPGYLVLLLLVPPVWLAGLRSLAGLGTTRWLLANLLRSIGVLLLVLALAELQILKTGERLTVLFLLDQSESIPLAKRQAMLEYTVQAVARHRDKARQDRAGVIVFGRHANIEIPPFDDDIAGLGDVGSYVNLSGDATSLEAALKLAKASFPEDSAKRVVIVTDGNENLGDARSIAANLAEDGVGIDVLPVRIEARAEVSVEKITLPADIRRGQPMETRVVLENHASRPIRGKLKVTRRVGPNEEFLSEEEVTLQPGKNVYAFSHKIEQAAVYTYQADFAPLDPRDDAITRNNRAAAFTHVRGRGRVLLIEDWEHPGEFDHLVDRLRLNNIEVTVQRTDRLFASLAELQAFDAVILANVPRSSGDDAQAVASFSDQQIQLLVRSTEQMGCGLVMLGGPNSFGAGGWSNTEIEKAMPVDFQINNATIRAVGALALIMHASELADGNYWQKEVARQAILALGPMDYCGLLHWDYGGDKWLWGDASGNGIMRVGDRRNLMLARLGRMSPGDMPEFDPGLKKTLAAFHNVNASVKLAIVISDGDPTPPSLTTVMAYQRAGISVSTVAIGAHGPAGHKTLQDLADGTGGRYYRVTNPKALPKIYVNEVRRVSRPLVFEPPAPLQPQVAYPHEILEGIEGPLPPISGFVLTTVKENPLVEVAAISPQPSDARNATVLAAWTYGLGRTAVLTTDAGKRWACSWMQWPNYDKLFTQLVRWSMRPIDDQSVFSVATDVRDGKARVVVTARDKDHPQLDFLNMSATVVDPDLASADVKIQQVAPGRYVGEFEATKEGNYFVTVNPSAGRAPLFSGVNVPYSAEYRDRQTNMGLLQSLARLRPRGGSPGVLIEGDLRPEALEALLLVNPFRQGLPPAVTRQGVWPSILVIFGCLFFADVLARRVSVGVEWWPWTRQRLRAFLQRRQEPAVEERLERLRSRKAEVDSEIDERRAATRFEPIAEEAAAAPGRPPAAITPAPPETESYTERLLQAKQRAWKEKPKPPDKKAR